jgi:hypothetical protein
MIRFVLCAAVLSYAGAAAAQRFSPVDGNKLLGFCTSKSPVGCDAYISGVADAIAAGGPGKAPACIPDGVTGVQLRDVMVKYLKAHPESRQQKAGTLTVRALGQAFPCKS